MQPLGLGCLGLLFCTRALTLLLLAAGVLLGKLHFSYAGMTCYYAFLVGESLLESSDRAVARASSLPRQPFKGQLNASRAQSDSKDPIKNKDFHQASQLSRSTTIKTAVAVPAAAAAVAGRKKGPFTFASTVRELSKWDSRSSSTTKNQATFLVKPLKE